MVIAATNHAEMLDKAAWRRFETKLELSRPTLGMIENWLNLFQERIGHNFGISNKTISQKLKGLSFGEIEDFALDIQRRYILGLPDANIKNIVDDRLKHFKKI